MKPRTLFNGWNLPQFGVTVFILSVGLLVSGVAAYAVAHRAQSEAQTEFGRKSALIADQITQRLSMPAYGLKGARGTFAASERVERREFEAYVSSRDLASEFPGTRGFGFVERVQRTDLQRHAAAVQLEDQLLVVQPQHLDLGVVGQAQHARAHAQLGTAAARGAERTADSRSDAGAAGSDVWRNLSGHLLVRCRF